MVLQHALCAVSNVIFTVKEPHLYVYHCHICITERRGEFTSVRNKIHFSANSTQRTASGHAEIN